MASRNIQSQTCERPLTLHMMEGLMDCHEREILNQEPNEAFKFHPTRGLVLRRMAETRWLVNKEGKRFLGVFVTNRGRKYLNQLSQTPGCG